MTIELTKLCYNDRIQQNAKQMPHIAMVLEYHIHKCHDELCIAYKKRQIQSVICFGSLCDENLECIANLLNA